MYLAGEWKMQATENYNIKGSKVQNKPILGCSQQAYKACNCPDLTEEKSPESARETSKA